MGDVRYSSDSLRLPLNLLPFGPALPSPTVRYGLACLAAERAGSNPGSPHVGQVWRHLLGALRSPGAWEWTEPEFWRLREGPHGPKLAALLSRGQCDLDLAQFRPIGPRGARLLEANGIRTADQLLRGTTDPAARATLTKRTGITDAELQTWGKLAELAVVLEIAGPADLEPETGNLVSLASLASIGDVLTMANVTPIVVADAMRRANEANAITAPMNFEPIVGRWKTAAGRWVGDIGRPGESSMIRPSPPPEATEDAASDAGDEEPKDDKPKNDEPAES